MPPNTIFNTIGQFTEQLTATALLGIVTHLNLPLNAYGWTTLCATTTLFTGCSPWSSWAIYHVYTGFCCQLVVADAALPNT